MDAVQRDFLHENRQIQQTHYEQPLELALVEPLLCRYDVIFDVFITTRAQKAYFVALRESIYPAFCRKDLMTKIAFVPDTHRQSFLEA